MENETIEKRSDVSRIKIDIPNRTAVDYCDMCIERRLEILSVMSTIEEDLGISMHDCPFSRNTLLDLAGFIRRLPNITKVEGTDVDSIKITLYDCKTVISYKEMCRYQYNKILALLSRIERELDLSIHNYPNIQKKIFNLANFMTDLPRMTRVDSNDYSS